MGDARTSAPVPTPQKPASGTHVGIRLDGGDQRRHPRDPQVIPIESKPHQGVHPDPRTRRRIHEVVVVARVVARPVQANVASPVRRPHFLEVGEELGVGLAGGLIVAKALRKERKK